ncbi:MAG: hypothetical protein ABIR30_00790 [Chitinophagaceae bacterium]
MNPGLQKPFFLLFLPVFFFLHVLNENFNPVLVTTAFKLILLYGSISLLLALFAWIFFRDLTKAAIFGFACMAINFFFGLLHDLLIKKIPGSFLVKYSFILPFIVLLLLLLVIYLKRTKRHFVRSTKYLNLLLLVLVVLDAVMLVRNIAREKTQTVADLRNSFTSCDTCSKPDIYLIIADEYAGKQELEDIFSFNNDDFENQLKNRGFYVGSNTVSNYNATAYSMASLLNMDYLHELSSGQFNYRDMLTCRNLINKNNTFSFFKEQGYSIYNYSFFDADDKKKAVRNYFYPTNSSLLTFQTLISRLQRSVGFHLFSGTKIEKIKRNDLYNNQKADSLTKAFAGMQKPGPAFVYTHLNLPHHGYFYDSTGRITPLEVLTDEFTMDKQAYTSYLKYSNRKLIELVDHIRNNSPKPPVIILLSDHGFRQFPPGSAEKYYFMNLNAVYFPGGDYSGFYQGISNVNEFRVILNTLFKQRLPLLKDSTSFLVE